MTDNSPIAALEALESEALAAIAQAPDAETLEEARVTFLGRSDGRISSILRGLGQLPPEERPGVGQAANRVKGVVSTALEERLAELSGPSSRSGQDLTMPARGPWKGSLHPITQAVDEIWHIFRDLGFSRARVPRPTPSGTTSRH